MPLAASQRLLRELAEWRPPQGVLSVCLDVDPADRGEGWRIALRERVRDAVSGAGGGDRDALEQAGRRVLERFPANAPHGEGRTQLGFVGVGAEGRDLWHGIQLRLVDGAEVTFGARPRLVPLARLLRVGARAGAVVAASERVRVLEWALGRTEQLDDLELELYSLDWRERKSPRRNPQAGGTGTSAAGRDQYGQRLEHNRERFLREAGELIAGRHGERDWAHLIVFGNSGSAGALRAGLGPRAQRAREVHADLIGAGVGEIGERITTEIAHLNAEREVALVARIEDAVGAEPSAALGPDEVLRVLEQGRARHAVFDHARDLGVRDGVPVGELIVGGAALTDAEATPVGGEAADALAKREGAAALLRY
ncbi:MAG: VLRF1 family aeRF1-type release factor [Solirubrobacterales bacterium]